MLLSLSGFLFEDGYASQSVPFPEFCALAASAGYRGVELRGTQVGMETPRAGRAEALRAARDAGLAITCLTARGLPAAGPARDDFFRRHLDLCRDLDCRLLKISADAVWLRGAAARAGRAGVALAVNNHIGSALETVAGTREHLAGVGHPNYGLLYDCLHLRVAGQDYVGCIAEFVSRVRGVLVHSVRPARAGEPAAIEREGARWAVALPDEPGAQDWGAVLGAFRGLGYAGPVTVVENGWPREQRAFVARRCAEVIRRLWQEGAQE